VRNSRKAAPDELVVLGRIVKPQGLKGELRVLPSGLSPALSARFEGKRLLLRPPPPAQGVREVFLVRQRWHRGMWIVALDQCADRNTAESLVGWDVCIEDKDRPHLEDDSYYSDQLVGLRAVDAATGEVLGEVTAVIPSAASDLFEVRKSDGGRFLVPAVKAMVRKVDIEAGVILVDLPEGLVDINP